MSRNWTKDIADMHSKFGTNAAVSGMTADKLKAFLEFRVKFLDEELTEIKRALEGYDKNGELTSKEAADAIIDGCIDLCVVAIGTLDAFDVDAAEAWNRVYAANMSKEVGVKEGRPNPLGLPDLVKPKGWVAPTHEDLVTEQLLLALETDSTPPQFFVD